MGQPQLGPSHLWGERSERDRLPLLFGGGDHFPPPSLDQEGPAEVRVILIEGPLAAPPPPGATFNGPTFNGATLPGPTLIGGTLTGATLIGPCYVMFS